MTGQSDTRAYRDALSQFVTGITIVTAAAPDGAPLGLTMNSFSSVSLDPPLILFSVDRRAWSLADLEAASGYAVNVLSAAQRNLSDRFARQGEDKWADLKCRLGHGNAPLLPDTVAQFECAPFAAYDGGDHVIFVGRVVHFSNRPATPPLVYHRGSYVGLDHGGEQQVGWPLAMHY